MTLEVEIYITRKKRFSNKCFVEKVKRCKGYTLMELIVVMAIIAIMLSFCTLGGKWYKTYLNRIDTNYTGDSIFIFITNAKQYCREKESRGCICFNTIDNQITFVCNGKLRDSFQLPKGFNLYGTNLTDNMINIDGKGFTSDACTIKFRDKEGRLHSLTLCVGTAYVEIQN